MSFNFKSLKISRKMSSFVLVLILWLSLPSLLLGQRRRSNDSKSRIPVTIVDDEKRLVNWCVTGVDEPEFNFYPINEFVPYFQRTQQTLVRSRDKTNRPKYDYTLNLVDVRYRDGSVGVRGALHNTAHLKFGVFKLREYALGIREVLEPITIEGLAIQVNHAPHGIAMPTARFVFTEEEIICFDCVRPQGIPIGCRKRTAFEIQPPTIMVYHHKMVQSEAEIKRRKEFNEYKLRISPGSNVEGGPKPPICSVVKGIKNCDPNIDRVVGPPGTTTTHEGPTNEIHGTLVWHFPPCTVSRAVEFVVLVVHSFERQDFEIFSLGPYELPDISGSVGQSFLAPTPFFKGFRENIICDTEQENTVVLSDSDRSSRVTYPFDYSYHYDMCLRNSTKENGAICAKPPPTSCVNARDRTYHLKVPRCAQICTAEVTTAEITTKKKFFKRSLHGGINMITNFCLQPICIFVGRYYKETFNRNSYKGVKLWYWIHFIGGGIASVFQYFGYFHPTWVQKTNQHSIAGNIMIMMLAICYCSSWIRHRNPWMTSAAEFFHGASGYCVSGLAFWCLHTAPGVSDKALALVYAATGLLAFGYIVMECCIFLLDRKFGMQPFRRHFPTVEARFDDLPVPQRPARIAFLFFLTSLMLVLTSLTIVV